MYTDYYQLSSDPFRLTPDYRFVYPHQSYLQVRTAMCRALEQGEGILVATGRSGTGKTTLVDDFLAGVPPGRIPTAKLVSTQLENDDLLRMVAYAFGLDIQNFDKARILFELEAFLKQYSRGLLVIDEAQNLPASALEELRLLTNIHADGRPLLQVFLIGQEKLRDRLHDHSLEQLQQRMTTLCELRVLSLADTQKYILHRLACVGWQGNPAIETDVFILVHRCSRGLPRYLCKLGSHLLQYCAEQQKSTLALKDVATVALEMHGELLLPLTVDGRDAMDVLPDIEAVLRLRGESSRRCLSLSPEEEEFLAAEPEVITTHPSPPPQEPRRLHSIGIADDQADLHPARPAQFPRQSGKYLGFLGGKQLGFGVAGLAAVLCAYQLGSLSARHDDSSNNKASIVTLAATVGGSAPDSQVSASDSEFSAAQETTGQAAQSDTTVPDSTNTLPLTQWPADPTAVAGIGPMMQVVAVSYSAVDSAESVTRESAGAVPATPATTETAQAIASLVKPASSGDNTGIDPGGNEPGMADAARGADTPAEGQPGSAADQTPAVPEITTGRDPGFAGPAPGPMDPPALASDVLAALESPGDIDETPADLAPAVAPAASDGTEAAVDTPPDRVSELLQLGDRAIARDRLQTPEDQSAWFYYREILAMDPENPDAIEGLQRIADRYAELAAIVMERGEYDKARQFVTRGLSVAAADPRLLNLNEGIDQREAETVPGDPLVAESEPAPSGFFGKLKKIFGGD